MKRFWQKKKQIYEFFLRYIMDSEPVRVTPSENTKLYLT